MSDGFNEHLLPVQPVPPRLHDMSRDFITRRAQTL
jgi:hypothetical protein